MLLIGFGVFLVRHIAGIVMGEPLVPVLLGFHVLVVLILSLSERRCGGILMCPSSSFGSQSYVLGLPVAFFLMLQHRVTIGGRWPRYIPLPLPFWLLLIFTYGMFIPNTWRHAAIVIGAIGLAPLLLVAGTMLAYPRVAVGITVVGMTQHTPRAIHRGRRGCVRYAIDQQPASTEVSEAKQLGQYRLVKRLGVGGMGEVYLAEHRMLKRRCAVKLIHPDRSGDPHVRRIPA